MFGYTHRQPDVRAIQWTGDNLPEVAKFFTQNDIMATDINLTAHPGSHIIHPDTLMFTFFSEDYEVTPTQWIIMPTATPVFIDVLHDDEFRITYTTRAEHTTDSRYRTGRKQPKNIYRHNPETDHESRIAGHHIAVAFTPQDAAIICDALNAHNETSLTEQRITVTRHTLHSVIERLRIFYTDKQEIPLFAVIEVIDQMRRDFK